MSSSSLENLTVVESSFLEVASNSFSNFWVLLVYYLRDLFLSESYLSILLSIILCIASSKHCDFIFFKGNVLPSMLENIDWL